LSFQESLKDNSVALLRILGAGNWNELVALSEELKAFIPAFPTSLAKEWKRPTLISTNIRYYFVALNLEGIASSSSKRDRD
jgi:hypothetical protein